MVLICLLASVTRGMYSHLVLMCVLESNEGSVVTSSANVRAPECNKGSVVMGGVDMCGLMYNVCTSSVGVRA